MSLTKEEKKAWKKGLHKARQPWKAICIITGITSVISLGFVALYSMVPNTFGIMLKDKFSEASNLDSSKEYYKKDFTTEDEKVAYEKDLVQRIEGEGAVLLKNESNTLPLKTSAANKVKVSCFSTSSVDIVYGGTGSGSVDTKLSPTLKDSLEASNFEVNQTLWDFYDKGAGKKYRRKEASMMSNTESASGEAPWSIYTEEVKASVEGSEAIIVLSRTGGEGSDLTHKDDNDQLVLDSNEREMMKEIAKMKQQGKINHIIVLLNSSNAIQLDFIDQEDYGVDACLWIGGVGSYGLNSVTEILNGNINPSGCLPDTFLKDNESSPAMKNFNTQVYEGAEDAGLNSSQKNYVVYQEGIYVGYRYYETRYEDFVTGKGNAGDYKYSDCVAYPFGYGQSYTTFSYESVSEPVYDASTDQISLSVRVRNTGKVAGKKTVQLYATVPYTNGGIEKASVQLAGFSKTEEIAPNNVETVTISVDRKDLASYSDTLSHDDVTGGYVLEQGLYYLTVGDNAHDAANNMLAMKGYSTALTSDRMDKNGTLGLSKIYTVLTDDYSYCKSTNGKLIQNQFDGADLTKYENSPLKGMKYVSRSDWENTLPTSSVRLTLNQGMIKDLAEQRYEVKQDETLPLMNQKNNIKAFDMKGLDYNDPKWDTFIQQMSFDEMCDFIGNGFHVTQAVESLNLQATRQENGPQGLNGFFGMGKGTSMAITSVDILAATFSREIAGEVGKCIANDCLTLDIDCLYGPGNNTHRTPYGGRNFEYYSEDCYLSSIIATNENREILKRGIRVEIKHFVMNDCEENRTGLGTWANEQSIREIYLKAFERTFEENPDAGVMTSYCRLGTTWCGANEGLLTNVLRGEWGAKGFIISDNTAMYSYMNGIDGVLAGTDLFDSMMSKQVAHLAKASKDATVIKAMQRACKNNAYNIINSAAMNGYTSETIVRKVAPFSKTFALILMIVSLVAFVACLVLRIVFAMRYRKEHPLPKN